MASPRIAARVLALIYWDHIALWNNNSFLNSSPALLFGSIGWGKGVHSLSKEGLKCSRENLKDSCNLVSLSTIKSVDGKQ